MFISLLSLFLLVQQPVEAREFRKEVVVGYSNKADSQRTRRSGGSFNKCGKASWYGKRHRGRKTASGERFNPREFTAASWNYRLGSRVEVWSPQTGRSVIVRINDRGPARRLKRIIDLSERSFKEIANPRRGIITVCVKELHK